MSPLEFVLVVACLAGVITVMVMLLTTDAFSEMMSAWAKKHSEETRNAIANAWVEGHEAGQEYARLRGSKTD